MSAKPTVIVSKSEPQDAVQKLCAFGLNAVAGEAGTDYVWYPHSQCWGIERKTVSNLLQSLADRQLVEQTHRGSSQFDRYIILIEGEYRRSPNGLLVYYNPFDPRGSRDGWVESKWQYSAVAGMIFSLHLIGTNVMTHHWPVLWDSPTAIASIVHATSSDDGGKFIRERQRPGLPPEAALGGKLYESAAWALMALPGCGPEVASAMLKEWGSLAKAVEAIVGFGCPTWLPNLKVNGKRLGDKRAERIRSAVLQEFT